MPASEKSCSGSTGAFYSRPLTALARIISIIFHPLLMPTYGVMLLLSTGGYFSYSLTPGLKITIVLIVALNTFLLPSLATLFLWRKKIISNLTISRLEERRIPYLITAGFYLLTGYVLKNTQLPPVLYLLALGATLSVLLTLFISLRWKISAHMVGVGGLVGAFSGMAMRLSQDMLPYISLLIIIAGLTGSARLKLNAHTPAQVYAGFFLGLLCQLLLFGGL